MKVGEELEIHGVKGKLKAVETCAHEDTAILVLATAKGEHRIAVYPWPADLARPKATVAETPAPIATGAPILEKQAEKAVAKPAAS